jgi:hypothetical protein
VPFCRIERGHLLKRVVFQTDEVMILEDPRQQHGAVNVATLSKHCPDKRISAIVTAPGCAEAQIPVPEWADGDGRFAEPWWFVTSRPAFHAYVLAQTPSSFARHGVFVAREAFDRA